MVLIAWTSKASFKKLDFKGLHSPSSKVPVVSIWTTTALPIEPKRMCQTSGWLGGSLSLFPPLPKAAD